MTGTRFNRRLFLGGAIVSVSALHLVGCVDPSADLYQVLEDGQYFSADELTLLNDVAEIMIPRTDTPGAQDAEVAAVVDGLMLTWAVEDTRRLFKDTLSSLDDAAKDALGAPYRSLSRDERYEVVEAMDVAAFADDADSSLEGYRRLKKLIFHVFYTSQQGSTSLVPIPGGYEGNLTLAQYNALMEERSYGG